MSLDDYLEALIEGEDIRRHLLVDGTRVKCASNRCKEENPRPKTITSNAVAPMQYLWTGVSSQ